MFIDTRRSSLVTAFNRLTTHRHAGMAWLLGAALLCPICGLAEGTRFDIPPQSLGTALDRVAKEAGLRVAAT